MKLNTHLYLKECQGSLQVIREKYKMTIKTVVVSIVCIMIAGCAPLSMQDEQAERQMITIYDNKGNVKEHVIINDDYIRIYDKDWKTKGYGKVQK